MTISSTNRKAGPYPGNGAATTFPFAFNVFAPSDVVVVLTNPNGAETTLTLGADYSIDLNADQDTAAGGTVALPAALASGNLLTITSDVPAQQPVDLTNQGGFYPRVINSALDRLTILVQQLTEKVSRAVKVNISSNVSPDQLVTELVNSAAQTVISASEAAGSAHTAQAAAESTISLASAAAGSATSASSAQAAAAMSAAGAASSATAAKASAEAAASSQSGAATSATAASGSAAAASSSASNAAGSASSASNSASAAAGSASAASTSATSAGTSAAAAAASAAEASAAAAPRGVALFVSSGIWVCPGGITKVEYEMVGGGGGGGAGSSGGGGGGAGEYKCGTTAVTPGNSYSITVGAAGQAVVWAAGGAGGTTSAFGVTAAGGAAGQGGGSGVGFGGSRGGTAHFLVSPSGPALGGNGGNSPFGSGGSGGRKDSTGESASGVAATGYGAGGGGSAAGGGSTTSAFAGAGTPGLVKIRW